MKTLKILTTSIFFLIFLATGGYADKEGKMGYVNLNRIFNEYQKTVEYDKTLEAKHGDYEKERNPKVDKIKEAQGKLDLLKEKEKAKLQEDIENMKAELIGFDKQKTTDLTKERNEMTREILLEIEQVINAFAKENNYSLIFNNQFLIYGDEKLDITEQILNRLNNTKKK